MISQTPIPPYYAVIFTSISSENDKGYAAMLERMIELASKQDGFLGIESARENLSITVSYWQDLDSIKIWRENTEHKIAQEMGNSMWYKDFKVPL